MASNRFRYPPAPNNGGDTFSDYLVGNQFMGSQQMTLGNFTSIPPYNQPTSTEYNMGTFSSPITLDSLNIENLALAQQLSSNNLEVFVNNDISDISSLVLYGSLKKRLAVATQNIVNFFPGAIFVDGVNTNYVSGNTTAYDILYNLSTKETTFKTSVNTLSNPFSLEFTTNGNQLNEYITKEQILNNFDVFGMSADTLINIADGTVSPLRNLTKEFKKYSLSFGGAIGEKEYKITQFIPQTINNDYLVITVKGNPFNVSTTVGSVITTTTDLFYVKPTHKQTEEEFKKFHSVEAFLVNRDISPIYTAQFTVVKETTSGVKYYDKITKTWPLEDNINIDTSTENYSNYLISLADLGEEIDREKTNLVSRFLTAPTLKEFDGTNQKVEKTLQIYGRSFDDIKTFVEGIAYMTNVSYDGKNNIPNELIKNFARTLGWTTPSTLNNTTFLDSVLGTTTPQYSGTSISRTPAELDIELYRRILLNAAYLFKSKGTRKSIEFLLGLVGAPQALVEFNEYVVLADAKFNMAQFNEGWQSISGGAYTSKVIRYSIPFSSFTYVTGATTHPFVLSDYPIDSEGYPHKPRVTNNYFFQRGAGWFERTEEHKSDLIINEEDSVLSGCTPNIVTKFAEFTWGGFWTVGQYSNNLNAPYLDRFRRFPHMPFGFHLERIIDDKKSWVEIGEEIDGDPIDYSLDLYKAQPHIDNVKFKDNVLIETCGELDKRIIILNNKLYELQELGISPNWQKQIRSRITYINMVKANKCKKELETREYNFKNRSSYYQTTDERLVLNVKNVDLCLNIGQGLVYDVWRQSSLYNCMFSGGTLPPPYPSSGGTWDSTNPQINAKKLDFKIFHHNFWKVFIDTKNRMTINDGKTGGYPTLQQMYLDYLQHNCGANNQYTYKKMIDYAQSMGDYWIRIIEQMIPSTTLWTSGVKIENSVFHRDKFVYRCFSMSGSNWDSGYTTTFTVNPTGYTSYPAPQFQARMMSFSAPPAAPAQNTLYYNSIISGQSTNPVSTYANSYDINNKSLIGGSKIVAEEVKILANEFYTNKRIFTMKSLFTKQGSTNNLLCVYGLKEMGTTNLGWLNSYNLNSGGIPTTTPSIGGSPRSSSPNINAGRGRMPSGGGY